MSVRIAINGVGRIGRCIMRAVHESHPAVEIIAVNDVIDAASLARLLQRDSVYGRFPAVVQPDGDAIVVADTRILVWSSPTPRAPRTAWHPWPRCSTTPSASSADS